MKVVVNTPAGNIGRVVVDALLEAKQDLVIISRHPEKVAEAVRRGARLVTGSIDDPEVLRVAFAGADALFWVTPPAYDRPDFIEWVAHTAHTAAAAATESQLKRVVLVSSAGAQGGPGSGPIGALLAVERAFNQAVPNVTILRAGPFMENFLNNVGTIAGAGSIYGPLLSAERYPYVATRDVGEKAAEALRDATWSGFRILGVHGPEDLDQTRAAQIIGEALGRPVAYVEVAVDQAKHSMRQAGMPSFLVDLLGQMYTAARERRTSVAEPRSSETTGRTSLLQFATEILKPAVEAARRY